MNDRPSLRKGWTTGACAAAGAKAAFEALLTGRFPDPVTIRLPRGERPSFALAERAMDAGTATAGIVKDAGDDPDVTHGVLVRTAVRAAPPGGGIAFAAGSGVGTVTRPGLPLAPGEPAINPGPRAMIADALRDVAEAHDARADVEVTISIPGGEALAEKTWNPRLGIVGGLSVLGTTGIVVPYSCSAWIHSIHRGIDVARANGFDHVVAATGKTSEQAARDRFGLPLEAMIDMGDFAGGMLKYLRRHPVPRVTIAGGFAKMVKLGQGNLDLHSARSQVDFKRLADTLAEAGGNRTQVAAARTANTAAEVLEIAGPLPLAQAIADAARRTAQQNVRGAATAVETMVVDRRGRVLARSRDG